MRQGDFVLRLTEGLGNPEQTLENYVVTPELAKCFRQALDLVKSSLQSHSSKGSHAHGTAEYIDLDNGLSVISNHAKSLGYDAIILVLDELILWLASHAGKPEFVTQQGQLLAKLVESQNAKRDVPLISFIARQKSLRELVGDTMLGAQYVSLDDSIKHFDQRFDVIKLEDRNLPTIAQKRVLKPKSEAARQQIDESFRQTEKIRRNSRTRSPARRSKTPRCNTYGTAITGSRSLSLPSAHWCISPWTKMRSSWPRG